MVDVGSSSLSIHFMLIKLWLSHDINSHQTALLHHYITGTVYQLIQLMAAILINLYCKHWTTNSITNWLLSIHSSASNKQSCPRCSTAKQTHKCPTRRLNCPVTASGIGNSASAVSSESGHAYYKRRNVMFCNAASSDMWWIRRNMYTGHVT